MTISVISIYLISKCETPMRNFINLFFLVFLGNFIQLKAQYEMPVYSVSSFRTEQPGTPSEFTIDGNHVTIYHSLWNINGIPDTLNFIFSSRVNSINKLEYTPRPSGPNGIWTKVDVLYSTKENPDQFILVMKDVEWPVDNDKKTLDFPSTIVHPATIRIAVNEAYANFSSCAEMRFYGPEPLLPDGSIDCVISTDDINAVQDTKVPIDPIGTIASSFQSGENIEKSFDSELATLYHSNYNDGAESFPMDLVYHFVGSPVIDYLKYIPRNDGGNNGFFGKVTVSYNTSDSGQGSTFQEIVTYNFAQKGVPSSVYFPTSIQPLNIKISVADGYGDFASCAEMEFYKKSGSGVIKAPYTNIFSNVIYSQLHASITQQDIDTISSNFYKTLAQCIFEGSYNRKYRVQDYEAFPIVSTTAKLLKTSSYDQFENMTGIAFQPGEKVILFVEQTPPTDIYLRVRDFANEDSPADHSYQLVNGMNIINMDQGGLGYISYYSDESGLPKVKINIVNGFINGYYDVMTSDKNDWVEILTNSAYPKVDLRGKYVHFVFDKIPLRSYSPVDGQDLINRYDTIVKHERILMGLYKYDRSPANRQFGWTESMGGLYAGGLGAHFDLTWGPESFASPKDLGLWGIAHEFGHVNQIRPGLKWIGTTEVTNNIYSLWVYYHMNSAGEKFTRLESESKAADDNSPEITGGEFNGYIDATTVQKNPLQTYTNPFRLLIPFWQLELYYQLAGAAKGAPLLTLEENPSVSGVDYAHWYGVVAEKVRNTNELGISNGQLMLNFVKNTCDAVHEDLTDFFTNSGFLRPIDVEIDDYGIGQLTVTETEVEETIAYIKAKGYQPPASPVINYISAHSIDAFKNNLPLSGKTGIGVELIQSDIFPYLIIDNTEWKNTVAFETYDTAGILIHVSIVGTGDLSLATTAIQYPYEAFMVYAVGYDGSKILVYPKTSAIFTKTKDISELKLSPNPTSNGTFVKIKVEDRFANYNLKLLSINGNLMLNSDGYCEKLEQLLNRKLTSAANGTYLIRLKNLKTNQISQIKLIKE